MAFFKDLFPQSYMKNPSSKLRKLRWLLSGSILLMGPFFLVAFYGSVVETVDQLPLSDGLMRYVYIFLPFLSTRSSFTVSPPSFWDPFGHYLGFFLPSLLIWYFLTFLIDSKKASRIFFILLLMIGLMHLSSLLSIRSFLNASSIIATTFTHSQEFLSFLITYLTLGKFISLFLFLGASWWMYHRFHQSFLKNPKKLSFLKKSLLILSLLSLLPWINHRNWHSLTTYNTFVQIPYVLYKFLHNEKFLGYSDHIEDLQKNTSQNRLYVFVLGESVTRLHQHAYGYSRPTTPFFDQSKEVVLFSDAIAPYPSTSLVTHYTFNRGPYEYAHQARQMFNILHRAGFYTEYLTVQSGGETAFHDVYRHFDHIEKLERSYYEITHKNKKKLSFWKAFVKYITASFKGETANMGISQIGGEEPLLSKQYTGDLVAYQPLDNFLKLTSHKKKRFVFIHLEECHFYYGERILSKTIPHHFRPKTQFSAPIPLDLYTDGRRLKIQDGVKVEDYFSNNISYYDTCLAYSNRFLKKVIRRLKQEKNTQSFLIYESDHGDDIFQTSNNLAHGHYKGRAVFDIPFVLWTNAPYRKAHPQLMALAKERKKAPFMTDVLPFILYNLSDIQLNGISDFSFSPLSPSFNRERKRIVGYGFKDIDYDKKLKNQKLWYK